MDVTTPLTSVQSGKYRKSGRLVAVAALVGVASSGAVHAATSYTFQSLSDSSTDSSGLGINGSSEVVGQLQDSGTAAYSTGGGTLQSLGGTSSIAYGVNNNGIAVGSYEPSGNTLPFSIDTKSGTPTFTTLPGVPAGGQGTAYAVTGSTNASFVAVGVTQGASSPTLATEWSVVAGSVAATTLDTRTFAPGTTVGSTAFGVNQLTRAGGSIGVVGQVNTSAGNVEGFYYGSLSGSPTTSALYALGLGSGSTTVVGSDELNQANAISNAGEIVGAIDFGSGERAFIYDNYYTAGTSGTAPEQSLNGTYTDLGTLNGSDIVDSTGDASEALAINSSGYIVGDSTFVSADPAGEPVTTHAFLYVPGMGLEDLNALAAAALPSGYVLETATGINDSGDITGTAIDSNDINHAFLLTPTEVPEPTAMAGLLAAAGLGISRRSRTNKR